MAGYWYFYDATVIAWAQPRLPRWVMGPGRPRLLLR
jgi:hypothetical protein